MTEILLTRAKEKYFASALNTTITFMSKLSFIFLNAFTKFTLHFRIIDKVQSTFKIVVTCQFVLCGIVISLSIYKLSMNPGTELVLLTTIQYLVFTLIQLFMYCYFGNEITEKVY